jgi:YD repeat-containing protein
MKYWLAVLFATFSSASFAIVDMRNANYSNTWVDLELIGTGYELKVSRTYNSRSLFNGIFGFGWCSDLETKVDITPEGNLKLTECGAGQENYYFPREFNRKEIDKTISQIISNLRNQKKGDEKSLQSLEKELATNHNLRAKYAFDLKISVAVKEGTQFFANGREVENVIFSRGYYTRNLADGSSQRFSKEGHLTHVYDKNGNYIKIDYEKDIIREVSDNNGRKLNFKFYSNHKVKTINGPNNLTVEYKFENLDDLTWVKNAWSNTYTYQYDDMHDLIKATWPDNTFVTLAYDKKHDWVTSFQDREKCKEDYQYENSTDDPKNHYWSIVKKVCNKEVVSDSKYEFWHKTRADGEKFLWRVSSTINGNNTEVTYHEVFGKPVSIRKNGELFTYEYFANGQIKQKSTKFATLTYDYSKENSKVAAVNAVSKSDKGKVVRNLRTEFKYDIKGNLIWAANSEGQKVEMSYDPRGRISSIKDQAKKFVKIEYDEKSGKPAVVTRPGLGTIRVTYKSSGEIDKVNSNEGPSVAMQVASTFSNLLEIISPATAEIYN